VSLRRQLLAITLAAACAMPVLAAQPAVLNIAFSVMPPWKTIDSWTPHRISSSVR